jgi:precorrin-6B methylase 2
VGAGVGALAPVVAEAGPATRAHAATVRAAAAETIRKECIGSGTSICVVEEGRGTPQRTVTGSGETRG